MHDSIFLQSLGGFGNKNRVTTYISFKYIFRVNIVLQGTVDD